MQSLLYQLKDQVTLMNAFILMLLAALIFYRFQKKRIAKFISVSVLILFLLISTDYLPHYLAKKLEDDYPSLSNAAIKNIKGNVFIHVLGSGYTHNKTIPPNAQIGLVALGRLAEAIRVYRLLDSAVIVCSGNGPGEGKETQAQVTKNAAVVLGIPAGNLVTLNTPTTTLEEADALAKQLGKNKQVIISTDAIHMPRAIRFFKAAGFLNPVAAPTNFKAVEDEEDSSLKWLPSMDNIVLTNQVFHEYLGNIKAILQ